VSATASRAPDWSRRLAAYRKASLGRGLVEIAITLLPLIGLWIAAWALHRAGFWWASLLLTIPASLFLVRLFMIQHDCGHGSFLPWKAANDWVGRILGVFTLTPYEYWRTTHAIHHATSGNLDRRSLGVIEMMTVDEYKAMTPAKRLGYRLYRSPWVMFGLGPAFVFFIQQRIPVGLLKDWKHWGSTLANTAAIAGCVAVMIWVVGAAPILIVQALTMLLAATIGVWLFYVQHQYEGVAWARNGEWKAQDAAIAGSSHYELPAVLRWFTANIGIHHVHHLSSRIPFYRLSQVLKEVPELDAVPKVRFIESLKFARLALWDEAGGRLVSFREARSL